MRTNYRPLPRAVHSALKEMRHAVINVMDNPSDPVRRAQWLADFYAARAKAYRAAGVELA